MKHRHIHVHNWQPAPPDGFSLVGLYVCSTCGALKTATAVVAPQLTDHLVTLEITLWIEYLEIAIFHQEKAVRQFRKQLASTKTPRLGQTLKHVEESLRLNKYTLRQLHVGAQMILGHSKTRPTPSVRLHIHRTSSTMSC